MTYPFDRPEDGTYAVVEMGDDRAVLKRGDACLALVVRKQFPCGEWAAVLACLRAAAELLNAGRIEVER